MQVRNLIMAAGAALAGVTAIAAAPTAASAQDYRYAPVYREEYRETYRPGYDYRRIEAHRYWEARRLAELRREEMRREYWRRHRHYDYGYGYRY